MIVTLTRGLIILAAFLCLAPVLAQDGATPTPSFDSKMLLKNFERAQKKQLKAFRVDGKAKLSLLKKKEEARLKSFDEQEKTARRAFFAKDPPGHEKRAYVHALLERRAKLRGDISQEESQAKQNSENAIRALKDRQKVYLNRFKDELRRGVRPPDSLWPEPNAQ